MKTSTHHHIFVYILLVSIIFCGCEYKKTETKTTAYGGQVVKNDGIFTRKLNLDEFEYKGHIYVSCDVRDGIAMTHAGHCWCNDIKK